MAFPTAVNDQITDSVTQANAEVLGDSPAMGMGNFFVATSQALSNSAHNSANAQLQSWTSMQAVTTQSVNSLLVLGTAEVGKSTETILESKEQQNLF